MDMFSSVAQSCLTRRLHKPQHTRPPCPSPTPGVYPNSCPLTTLENTIKIKARHHFKLTRMTKLKRLGFLWWLSGMPANAGDMSSVPGRGRSHMLWSNWAWVSQLFSLKSAAREPQGLRPACPRTCSPQLEATAMRSLHTATTRSPCLPPPTEPCGAKKIQQSREKKKKNLFKKIKKTNTIKCRWGYGATGPPMLH